MGNAPQYKRKNDTGYQPEMHVRNANSRDIFHSKELTSQFLRDYTGISLFKDIKPEDIEDVSERYHAFLGVEYEADTIKKVYLRSKDGTINREVYVIPLIEHKSSVDYDVAMQILYYMSVIWHDYKSARNKEQKNCNKRKNFRYPLIIPIVYYEGAGKWTAGMHLRDRIEFAEEMKEYIPDFKYHVVSVHKYTDEELFRQNNEMALVMRINKLQNVKDLEAFSKESDEFLRRIYGNAPEEIKNILKNIIWALLKNMNVPNRTAEEFMDGIEGGRGMGELFANAKLNIYEGLEELRKEKEKIEKQAEDAKQEAKDAKQQAADAELRAEKAEQRNRELVAELARLQEVVKVQTEKHN